VPHARAAPATRLAGGRRLRSNQIRISLQPLQWKLPVMLGPISASGH